MMVLLLDLELLESHAVVEFYTNTIYSIYFYTELVLCIMLVLKNAGLRKLVYGLVRRLGADNLNCASLALCVDCCIAYT